ncbi:APC family permease [Muricauda sp. SCSIO 64092]|uniref:APC family permease n=1 Tax=Allomuricauda sp. SCSIO 64092 TaxID=2908842 RepID=UPI001FF3B446|nr:APC family permease [Muricauda sp. SCSIO 64092]UOY05910.1 APC family permease [Muricauda sp. SCSIO 64092]
MDDKKIGLKEAVSIGIGGMVGGGIFAVLGLAVALAQGGTPIAFVIAGIIAFLTSYSYAKLSQAYPDRGGTVKFMNVGFGISVLSGGLNNLLWISYVIMLSLYASAFGSYAQNLLRITGDKVIDTHIFMSAIILLATGINYYSIKVVSKIESYAVIIKLVILLAFVAVGIYGLFGNQNLQQLTVPNWEAPLKLVTGGMVIFVAYEGFELIANAAPDIRNPEKNIARSYFISVLFVIALYVAIAVIAVGSLPFDEIAKAQDYVLAEAAKPLLGKIGFTVITLAALISTFSAINASLYGGSRVSFELAEDDELPHELSKYCWNQPIGLAITAVLTLIIANILDLESISTAGSIGFLLIFAMVNYVAFKKASDIKGKKAVALMATLLCLIALAALIVQQMESNLAGALIAIGIVITSFLVEFIYKRMEQSKP